MIQDINLQVYEMRKNGYTFAEIANALSCKMNWRMTNMSKHQYVYALYHGDNFIDIGTIRELATKQKIKPESMSFYRSKEYEIRQPNGYKLVRVDD